VYYPYPSPQVRHLTLPSTPLFSTCKQENEERGKRKEETERTENSDRGLVRHGDHHLGDVVTGGGGDGAHFARLGRDVF
jgi:hypothetical protein